MKKKSIIRLKTFFKYTYKWIKKMIMFGDNEIEDHKFHYHKNPILMNDVHINKMAVSN